MKCRETTTTISIGRKREAANGHELSEVSQLKSLILIFIFVISLVTQGCSLVQLKTEGFVMYDFVIRMFVFTRVLGMII